MVYVLGVLILVIVLIVFGVMFGRKNAKKIKIIKDFTKNI